MAYNARLNSLGTREKAANTMPTFETCFEGMQGTGLTFLCLKWVERIMMKKITGSKREITYQFLLP